MPLDAGMPPAPQRFTLYKGHKERPLQFEGELLAKVEASGIGARYRLAIYKRRDGKFISEQSLNSLPYLAGSEPKSEGEAAVFDTLAAACAWFPRGSLTRKLLKQLAQRGWDDIA